MLRIVPLLLLVLQGLNCATYNENTYFANEATLSPSVMMHWNYTSDEIIIRVMMKTSGWIGFGLSPNGGMLNSDILLAWPSSNGGEFRDAHVASTTQVIYDATMNWQKLFYSQNSGLTTLIFKRKIKVCNPNQDPSEININVEPTSYVIYAYGDNFSNGLPTYHGSSNRGSRSLPLLAANKKVKLDMSTIETVDFTVNSTFVDGMVTQYYCHMFKLPDDWTRTKRHVVRMETLVKESHKKYLHHWVMYECSKEYETVYLKNRTEPKPGLCANVGVKTPDWDLPMRYCNRLSLVWAVGGDLVNDIPPKLGYPLGGSEDETKFFFLEMHFENPYGDLGVKDNSGMRIYGTKQYREIEMGIYSAGAFPDPMAMGLPPNIDRVNLEYLCTKNDINRLLGSNQNVTLFAQLPHTHLAGRGFTSKLVRNNEEIEYISNNKYFDFNYQYINFMQKEVTLQRNDQILVSCDYGSKDRTTPTFGGFGTYDEMCLNFIWYYPRNKEYSSCFQVIDPQDWGQFFGTLNKTGEIKWNFTGEFNYNTFVRDGIADIMKSKLVERPEYLQQTLQEFYTNADRSGFSGNIGKVNVKRMSTNDCNPTATTATTNSYSSQTTSYELILNSAGKNNLGIFTALSAIIFSIKLIL